MATPAPAPLVPRDPAAEQLLAVMDVQSILEPNGKIRITQEMRQQGARIPNKIQSQVRRFLVADEPEKAGALLEFKYAEALKLLTEFEPAQRIPALAASVPEGDSAAGVIVAAGRAIKYLKDILPARSRLLMTGPETLEPNDLVKYRFRRAWAVVEEPMGLFDDLREQAISRDQVRTLQAVYPSLYDMAEKSVVLELARLKGDRPTIQLSRAKVTQIENLLLTRSWTPDLARVMQEAFGKENKPEGKPSTGLGDKSIQLEATPAQRAEAK